jgi:hypothetical protein
MTLKLKFDVGRSRPALELTKGGKERPRALLAVTRSNPLFVPYQGVIL